MVKAAKYRHQDVTVPPAGYKVRTIHAGKHLVRIAFPKGARKKGTGQLVSILHPKKEKNPACGGTLQLASSEIASLAIPLEVTGNGFGRGFEGALGSTAVENPTDWREYWEKFKGKISELIQKAKDPGHGESNPKCKKNSSEETRAIIERYHAQGKEVVSGKGGFFVKGVGFRPLRIARLDTGINLAKKRSPRMEQSSWRDYATVEMLSQRKRNYTEEVHTSDGKTVFVDVLGSGEKWMAEGYPVISGKIRRVAKPKIARGHTEAEAYDNLIAMVERNPRRKAKKNLDEIDAAAELAGKFKGSAAEGVREKEVPFKHRDDFGHLAWLYELVFHPAFDCVHLEPKEVAKVFHDIYENDESVKNSQQAWEKTAKHFNTVFLVFDFSGDEIELVSTAKGEQLELIGGNQTSFPQHFAAFRIRQKHDRDDLGDLVGITYLAKKEQFNDQKEKPYYHVFGENGGKFPRAYFDELNKRIIFTGGSYHLNEAEKGIIN